MTPFHVPGCKCNLCFVRSRVIGVDPHQAGCVTDGKKGCGCLACHVLRVALRGATQRAFEAEGFIARADGKYLRNPKQAKFNEGQFTVGINPKLPTV